MPSPLLARLGGAVALALVASAARSATASVPPPAHWKPGFDVTFFNDFQRGTANRCAQDQFDRSVNPNYAVDGSRNMANIINRQEWSRPILSPFMFRLLEQYQDADGNWHPRGVSYYPTYAQDLRFPEPRNNERGTADYLAGRFPVWLPSDTYADYVTPEQRRTSPSQFTDNQVFMVQDTPKDVFLLTVCLPGCFEGATLLSSGAGEAPIEELEEAKPLSLVTLAPESTREHFAFALTPVAQWISDFAPAEQDFVAIETHSGRHLDVTPHHPVLLASGIPRRAISLKAGDVLMLEDGSTDVVEHALPVRRSARAFNVEMKASSRIANFVAANGILSGTQATQLEDDELLVREVFRDALSKSELASSS